MVMFQDTFVHINWAKLGQAVIGICMMSDDRRPGDGWRIIHHRVLWTADLVTCIRVPVCLLWSVGPRFESCVWVAVVRTTLCHAVVPNWVIILGLVVYKTVNGLSAPKGPLGVFRKYKYIVSQLRVSVYHQYVHNSDERRCWNFIHDQPTTADFGKIRKIIKFISNNRVLCRCCYV